MGVSPPFDALYNEKDPHQCLIGVDIGTSKIEVAYALSRDKNPQPLNLSTKKLELQKSAFRVPSLVAVIPSVQNSMSRGYFSFGLHVESHLENDFIRPEHVFHNLKQCSCLVGPENLSHRAQRDALRKTQQKHESALKYARGFDQVELRLPRGRTEIYHREPQPGSSQKQFKTVEDILAITFLWLIDTIKASLGNMIQVNDLEIDSLFEGTRILKGVAVPDVLPSSVVAKYHEILVGAGFGDNVEMLSESRCAAVRVSQEIFMGTSDVNTTGPRAHDDDIDIDVCDVGHGTTDISTLRAVKNSAALRFTFPVESKGIATGGKVVEDHILAFLGEMFRGNVEAQIDSDVFLEHFRSGIANSKKDFKTADQNVIIRYAGAERLSQFANIDGIEFRGQTATIPSAKLEEAYETFLKPITRISNTQRGKKGLLEQHYSELADVGSSGRRRLFYLVGGGAIAGYTQSRIQSALDRIPLTAGLKLAYRPSSQHAYVAEGGVLMLADEELRKRRYHNESIGCIVNIPKDIDGNSRELQDRVVWFFMIGERIGDRPEVTQRYDYEIELKRGFDPTQADFEYPLKFQWTVARTTDERVGREQRPMKTHKKIKTGRGIVHEMDRELCEFIGWQRSRKKPWVLIFQFDIRLALAGNRIRCEITIPARGKFVAGCATKKFEVSISADVSHIAKEQNYKDAVDETAPEDASASDESSGIPDIDDEKEDGTYDPNNDSS